MSFEIITCELGPGSAALRWYMRREQSQAPATQDRQHITMEPRGDCGRTHLTQPMPTIKDALGLE